ncbi:MAG: hypothetical protein Q8O82_14070 [Pseudorhodobacter sp.]|nr:hypothetical protein [Pseudorhodobacter sp.]
MARVGAGSIAAGFMGKTHALAWRNVKAVLEANKGAVANPELAVLCDTPQKRAQAHAAQFGLARASADWRGLVAEHRAESG